MENNYYVYKHTASNGKVYIGVTKQAPEARWKNGLGYLNNKHFTQAIRKYGWESITHEIVANNLSQKSAEDLERRLIREYRSDDREFGYNYLSGGNVSGGGWHHTEETKKKISANSARRKLTQSQIRAMIDGRIKGVRSYDINGNYLKTYKSLTDAERDTGIDNSNIAACCKGRYGSICGYIFRYADDDNPVIPYYGKWRRVCQYSLDGEYIKTFQKISDAADEIGVHRHHITNVCKFKKISCGGYLWLYENEQDRLKEKIEQHKNRKRKICRTVSDNGQKGA